MKTICTCPKCGEEISGIEFCDPDDIDWFGVEVPKHCEKCGSPFPWTERKMELEKAARDSGSVDSVHMVEHIYKRFHLVARQLHIRHDGRSTLDIEDEYDVQDLLHALLKLYFDDIRPEEWTPSYAGASSRMDFLLKNESIVIEVKKTRKGLGAKELGEQLIVDIERYQSHPSCKTLLCFVYDPEGKIPNPQGLENDLSRKEDSFTVKVLIVPKGY